MKKLYAFAKTNLKQRFQISDDHVVASLLDPSQKNLDVLLTYIEPPLCKSKLLILKMEKLLSNLTNSTLNCTNVDEVNEQRNITDFLNYPPQKKARLSILSELEPTVNLLEKDMEREVQLYFNVKVDRSIEPLDWWKKNHESFPNLGKLAQIYLGIPATSASSEMAFSTAGSFMTAKRSSLHPAKLNKLCFLHDNYSFVKE